MYNLKQQFGESATEFLKRVRNQLTIAKSVGCNEFDDEETLSNIVLEGLHPNVKIYSATLAEQKATLLRDPSLVSITSLEEVFFRIDNNNTMGNKDIN